MNQVLQAEDPMGETLSFENRGARASCPRPSLRANAPHLPHKPDTHPNSRETSTSAHSLDADLHNAARRVVAREFDAALAGHHYTDRLLCQELTEGADAGFEDEAERVVRRYAHDAGHLRSGPFNALVFALYRRTGRDVFRQQFEAEALAPLISGNHTAEGAWTHPRSRNSGRAILLDSFQEEASRLAKLAWLRRQEGAAGWEGLERECLRQFHVHEKILRNPRTGLWSNGRGWIEGDPTRLSPGAWSRGHGWLLRGMAASFEYLATLEAREGIADLFQETAGLLAELQNESGMWPTLLHRPGADSPEESSGTAMLAAALFKGMRLGVLACDEFAAPAERAVRALCTDFLDSDGRIAGVCEGPGPLWDETPYLCGAGTDCDRHGAFAVVGLAVEARRFFNEIAFSKSNTTTKIKL